MNMEQLQELLNQREKKIENLENEINILKSKIDSYIKINNFLSNNDYDNNACKGYIIRALEDLEYSREQIKEVLNNLRFQFDELTIQEAKHIWINW